MTIKEFAEGLHGREYGKEITKEEKALLAELGYVVVFGYSDDNMELDGAIRDEIGCYNGGFAYFNENGLFENECEDEDCPYAAKERDKCKTIKAVWCGGDGYSWTYETDIPHAGFDIMEDGEKFCRGIIFDIKSLI